MYLCVSRVSILLLSTILIFDLGIVLTGLYILLICIVLVLLFSNGIDMCHRSNFIVVIILANNLPP
jgi:hypothetical protein